MFTGLVENTSEIVKIIPSDISDGMTRIHVRSFADWKAQIGDSIAVNGCCLTVTTNSDGDSWSFDVSRESLAKTNLGELLPGSLVNVERPMQMGSRLDGHIVTGHVDQVVEVLKLEESPSGWLLEVKIPEESSPLVIDKGSICLNGVSLTVNQVQDLEGYSKISLMLIPTTLEKTNLKTVGAGSLINVEYDIVGKYILRDRQLSR